MHAAGEQVLAEPEDVDALAGALAARHTAVGRSRLARLDNAYRMLAAAAALPRRRVPSCMQAHTHLPFNPIIASVSSNSLPLCCTSSWHAQGRASNLQMKALSFVSILFKKA